MENIYQALRESLALRPPPRELIGLFIRRQMASANDSQDVAGGENPREFLREAAQRFTGPSDRATDPNHPVGAITAAIRQALPDFQDWPLDAGEAAARFFTGTGEYRDPMSASKLRRPAGQARAGTAARRDEGSNGHSGETFTPSGLRCNEWLADCLRHAGRNSTRLRALEQEAPASRPIGAKSRDIRGLVAFPLVPGTRTSLPAWPPRRIPEPAHGGMAGRGGESPVGLWS